MPLPPLHTRKLILASASPRRRQLMEGLGWPFTVELPKEVEEIIPANIAAEEVPACLARLKSDAFGRPLASDELLITADTLVLCNGQVLGKPCGRQDAERMLKMLSGNTHKVLTGVCVRTTEKVHTFTATTVVSFRPLSLEEINYYIDRYQPYDKAGAYGVQEWIGYVGIERIEGSYYNVMGLPVQQLYLALAELG